MNSIKSENRQLAGISRGLALMENLTETRSILFVDDERHILGSLKRLLHAEPYHCFFAGSGHEALDLMDREIVHVIVTDINMPEMDGLTLIKQVEQKYPHIIRLVLTGRDDSYAILKVVNTGNVYRYIVKPWDNLELKLILKQAIDLFNLQQKERDLVKKLKEALDDLKRTQAQLLQSEKMASIGQLAAGVAHEINNPTTFVNVSAVTIEKWWKLFEPIFDKAVESGWDREPGLKKLSDMRSRFPKMIQSIQAGAARISSITNALREFARSDQEEKQLVDLRDILQDAVIMTKNQYKYHADLVIENGTEIPKIFGSSQKLEQVFINLIINATDATKEKADIMRDRDQSFQGLISIIISLRETPEETIEIVVKDNGIGMGADTVKKIFDPFFTTKPQNKGPGLGLSIAYGIIQDHGGGITVESTKGEETAFTITLPVEQRA